MLKANELAEIRRLVVRETNANRLRRWCIALLEDHGEMDRKLTAQKPQVSTGIVNSVNGRDEAVRSSET
ncbi:MAG: hypothetical protein ABW221_20610 [Vicinamibacteria bacterium]